jgi:hypothetical protein
MKINRPWLIILSVFLFLTFSAVAQKPKTPAKKPVKKTTTTQKPKEEKPKVQPKAKVDDANRDASGDEKKVRDMVAFLEFMLNTVGSSSTSNRDNRKLF